jgi:hypothetical protein
MKNLKNFYRLGKKCFHGEKETRSFEKYRSVGKKYLLEQRKTEKFF